ncbi:C40 family peptidase [Streptomyces murinus]|uniref:C40 family peptidase n=1 Tax=Streptomyces murinus TaxID=33900 RepID=UPI0037F7A75D
MDASISWKRLFEEEGVVRRSLARRKVGRKHHIHFATWNEQVVPVRKKQLTKDTFGWKMGAIRLPKAASLPRARIRTCVISILSFGISAALGATGQAQDFPKPVTAVDLPTYTHGIRMVENPTMSPNEGNSIAKKNIIKVVAAAERALGTPYLWGGNCQPLFTGDNRCDCSSLVKMAWSVVGVNLPRTTYEQVKVGREVTSISDLQAGDLLFAGGDPSAPDHVGMYIGNNQVIEAPRTGLNVRIMPLTYWKPQVLRIRRVA